VVNGDRGTARFCATRVHDHGKTGTVQNPHGNDHSLFVGIARSAPEIVAPSPRTLPRSTVAAWPGKVIEAYWIKRNGGDPFVATEGHKALNYGQLLKLIGAVRPLIIGIVLIMSAQHFADSGYERDIPAPGALPVLALTVFAVVIHLPIRLFDVSAYLLYGLALALLVAVLIVGHSKLSDARRFFALGPVNLAPSDVAKIALLLTLSRFFAYTRLPSSSKRRFVISAIIALIPAALILKQPDMGTSLVFFVLLFVLWFWSGLGLGYLFLIVSPIVSMVAASHWIAGRCTSWCSWPSCSWFVRAW
jgi:cell division protein FtsW (lipid II flippase)